MTAVSPETRPEFQLGKLAVQKGFLSERQLTLCLQLQDELQGRKKLGEILLEKKFLSPEQLQTLLDASKAALERAPGYSRQPQREVIFGRLAVKKGWLSELQINEALRVQGMLEEQGQFLRLGEVLVTRGYLTSNQVLDLLALQEKQVLRCDTCGAKYNVSGYAPDARLLCRKCQTVLTIPLAELDDTSAKGTWTSLDKVDEVDVEGVASKAGRAAKPAAAPAAPESETAAPPPTVPPAAAEAPPPAPEPETRGTDRSALVKSDPRIPVVNPLTAAIDEAVKASGAGGAPRAAGRAGAGKFAYRHHAGPRKTPVVSAAPSGVVPGWIWAAGGGVLLLLALWAMWPGEDPAPPPVAPPVPAVAAPGDPARGPEEAPAPSATDASVARIVRRLETKPDDYRSVIDELSRLRDGLKGTTDADVVQSRIELLTRDAEDRAEAVFQERMTRADAFLQDRRFGEALAALTPVPASLDVRGEYARRTAEEQARIPEYARRAFEEVKTEAAVSEGLNDTAEAIRLYEGTLGFGIPEITSEAQGQIERLKKLGGAAPPK